MQSDHFCNDNEGMRTLRQTHLLLFLKHGRVQDDQNYTDHLKATTKMVGL